MDLEALFAGIVTSILTGLVALAIEVLGGRWQAKSRTQRMGFIAMELDAIATWMALAEGKSLPVDSELRNRVGQRFQSLTLEMVTLADQRPSAGIGTALRRLLLLDLERTPLNLFLRLAFYVSLLLIPWRGYVNAAAQESWTSPQEVVVFAGVVVIVALPAIFFFGIARLIHLASGPVKRNGEAVALSRDTR